MSYRISLVIDTGGREPAVVASPPQFPTGPLEVTMDRLIENWNGLSAGTMAEELAGAIHALHSQTDHQREIRDLIVWASLFLSLCVLHPMAQVQVRQ